MVSIEDYCNFIRDVINQNNLTGIVSVYAFGSIAQGNFEKNYSDADLMLVTKSNSVVDRVRLVKEISRIFKAEFNNYLDKIHHHPQNKHYTFHDSWYFTEEEFVKYCKTYPTRAIYPFKLNVWKLVYGKNHFVDIALPDRKTCVKYLQYDFEIFSDAFHNLAFTSNTRAMMKYFLRAIKKAIWIINDVYLPSREDVITNASTIYPNDLLLKSVIDRIVSLKQNDYLISGEKYLDLYLDCGRCIEEYAGKIKSYVVENQYELINLKKYIETSHIGSFSWDFMVTLSDYTRIENNNKKGYIDFLTLNYTQNLKYTHYIVTNNLAAEEITLAKWEMPAKRSKILYPLTINKELYINELNIEGYKFLIHEHRNNLIENKFENMGIDQIVKYIEEKYLPAVYELFAHNLHRKSPLLF